jgi:hypothetical protein
MRGKWLHAEMAPRWRRIPAVLRRPLKAMRPGGMEERDGLLSPQASVIPCHTGVLQGAGNYTAECSASTRMRGGAQRTAHCVHVAQSDGWSLPRDASVTCRLLRLMRLARGRQRWPCAAMVELEIQNGQRDRVEQMEMAKQDEMAASATQSHVVAPSSSITSCTALACVTATTMENSHESKSATSCCTAAARAVHATSRNHSPCRPSRPQGL